MLEYTTPISSATYTQLIPYTERIRHLHSRNTRSIGLQKLIASVLHQKPSGLLLPRLLRLEWLNQSLEEILPLFHPGLKAFVTGRCEQRDLLMILKHIVSHAVALEELHATVDFEIDVSRDLAPLKKLACLRKLTLPFNYSGNVPCLLEVLASSIIEEIDLVKGKHVSTPFSRESYSPFSFTPRPGAESFRRLRILKVAIGIVELSQFLDNISTLGALECFRVVHSQPPGMCTAFELQSFFERLSRVCPKLARLTVVSHGSNLGWLVERVAQLGVQPITFETLRPILSCKGMIEFTLGHPMRVQISLDELQSLATSWRHIRELYLNPNPLSLSVDHSFSLTALSLLAKECPDIVELGLVLDASSLDVPSCTEVVTFPRLKLLHVGNSDLLLRDAVAFLAVTLPVDCKILCGFLPHQRYDASGGDFSKTQDVRRGVWTRAAKKNFPAMRSIVKFQAAHRYLAGA